MIMVQQQPRPLVDLQCTLTGLEVHPRDSIPYGQAYVMPDRIMVDPQGYDMILRGIPAEEALDGYKFFFLPAMGSLITWEVTNNVI